MSSVSAPLAASSRVPPPPASAFIESEPSRITSTERSSAAASSWAAAGAARARPVSRARTQQNVPGRGPGTLYFDRFNGVRTMALLLAALAQDRVDRVLDGVGDGGVEVEGEQRDEDQGDDGEDAAVLDGRLALLVVTETVEEVLDGDGGADADVLHGVTP